MSKSLEQIKNTLARITQTKDSMDILYEYERVMDQVGLSSYLNWYKGELLDGPKITKYWVECSWMYPKTEMPDPEGALRLTKIGCKVHFEDTIFNKPVKVMEPSDWEDRTTKKAKMDRIPVWVVTIKIPMKYIEDGFDDINQYLSDLESDDVVYSVGDESEYVDEFSTDDEGDSYSNFTGGDRI